MPGACHCSSSTTQHSSASKIYSNRLALTHNWSLEFQSSSFVFSFLSFLLLLLRIFYHHLFNTTHHHLITTTTTTITTITPFTTRLLSMSSNGSSNGTGAGHPNIGGKCSTAKSRIARLITRYRSYLNTFAGQWRLPSCWFRVCTSVQNCAKASGNEEETAAKEQCHCEDLAHSSKVALLLLLLPLQHCHYLVTFSSSHHCFCCANLSTTAANSGSLYRCTKCSTGRNSAKRVHFSGGGGGSGSCGSCNVCDSALLPWFSGNTTTNRLLNR